MEQPIISPVVHIPTDLDFYGDVATDADATRAAAVLRRIVHQIDPGAHVILDAPGHSARNEKTGAVLLDIAWARFCAGTY